MDNILDDWGLRNLKTVIIFRHYRLSINALSIFFRFYRKMA